MQRFVLKPVTEPKKNDRSDQKPNFEWEVAYAKNSDKQQDSRSFRQISIVPNFFDRFFHRVLLIGPFAESNHPKLIPFRHEIV